MSVISDTGPLIALAKIDHLHLLEQLFNRVIIPPIVYRELLAKVSIEADRLEQVLTTFVQVSEHPILASEVEIATRGVDAGEREALALAHTTRLLLLIDDRLGRQAAHRLNLSITGTTGILLRAKNDGHIATVRILLEQIRESGYWLSDELITTATKMAGEA
ncbi:MAG: DUF3368 domain-containing protein [Chloroflexi bacterium]|nr:DUF3368 domain-containing protein [Chloroflexota bacterium]